MTLASMGARKRYRNPPIEEAICEFRFPPHSESDDTIPARLRAALAHEYTVEPEEKKIVELGLEPQDHGPPNLHYREGATRTQFATAYRQRIVAVAPNALSVHMLRPYQDPTLPDTSGWDEFASRLAQALAAYCKIAKPAGVIRIGMRYINKILIPDIVVDVMTYLQCAWPIISGLPTNVNNFASRTDYACGNGIRLVLTQGSIVSPEEGGGLLIDLDVIYDAPHSMSQDDALQKVAELRVMERNAFEAVITDTA